jgi:hypothetical protein
MYWANWPVISVATMGVDLRENIRIRSLPLLQKSLYLALSSDLKRHQKVL